MLISAVVSDAAVGPQPITFLRINTPAGACSWRGGGRVTIIYEGGATAPFSSRQAAVS